MRLVIMSIGLCTFLTACGGGATNDASNLDSSEEIQSGSKNESNLPIDEVDGTIVDSVNGATDQDSKLSIVTYGKGHIITPDRLSYDFHAVGEFILLKSIDDDMEVQARFGSVSNKSLQGIQSVGVSVNGDKLYFARGYFTLVNGDIPPEAITDLPNGGRLGEKNSEKTVTWPDGSILVISNRGRYLDLSLNLALERESRVYGLLGNSDGDNQNDLVNAFNGQSITTSPSANLLYGDFAESWRVTDESSLLIYNNSQIVNETTMSNVDPFMPTKLITTDNIDDIVDPYTLSAIKRSCSDAAITHPLLLEQCLLTGAGQSLQDVEPLLPPEITVADVQGQIDVLDLTCSNPELIDDMGGTIPDVEGRYIGTFTDPEAELTWSSVLMLGQCGSSIQGRLTNEIEGIEQSRRLFGAWKNGAFVIETGEAIPYYHPRNCIDIDITLQGNQFGLSGEWHSTSCKTNVGNLATDHHLNVTGYLELVAE